MGYTWISLGSTWVPYGFHLGSILGHQEAMWQNTVHPGWVNGWPRMGSMWVPGGFHVGSIGFHVGSGWVPCGFHSVFTGVPGGFLWVPLGSTGFRSGFHVGSTWVPFSGTSNPCCKIQYFRPVRKSQNSDEHFFGSQLKNKKVDELCPFKIIKGEEFVCAIEN